MSLTLQVSDHWFQLRRVAAIGNGTANGVKFFFAPTARTGVFFRAYGAIDECIFFAPTARGAYGAEIDGLTGVSYKRSFLQVGWPTQ